VRFPSSPRGKRGRLWQHLTHSGRWLRDQARPLGVAAVVPTFQIRLTTGVLHTVNWLPL
jgi:hypothetical protein